MKLSKGMKVIFAALLALTLLAAAIHLTSREDVPPGMLAVEYAGETRLVTFLDLPMETVRGTRVNGKGETKEVDGEGCSLEQALLAAFADLSAAEQVTVVAADGFSAVVEDQEWEQPGQVCLIAGEEGAPQLIVFGDSDSKRSVKNVERLLVE